MALIHLTAGQEEPDLAPTLEPPVPTAWRFVWGHWARSSPHLALDAEGQVYAVAFGTIDGAPVVVSGGADATVRLWDARTGAPRGEPLLGHERGVNAVAFGAIAIFSFVPRARPVPVSDSAPVPGYNVRPSW